MPTGKRVVRSFIATEGRARAVNAPELPLETMVAASIAGTLNLASLQFERREIVSLVERNTSIAEISALLALPLRAAQVLVSEMVADGDLTAHSTVVSADADLLRRIRQKIVSL